MKLCAIHTLALWEACLGKLAEDASPDETERAVTYAREHLPIMIDSVSRDFDVVLLVADIAPSFRRAVELEPAWSEAQRPRPRAAWEGYRATLAELARMPWADSWHPIACPAWPAGAPMLDLGGGDALPLAGQRGAGRDVLATVARALERATHGKHGDALYWAEVHEREGPFLRIVSGRSSLLHLAFPGIEIVRDVRPDGTWSPYVAPADAIDPRLIADVKALALCGAWSAKLAKAGRSSLGEGAARKLVEAHGSALAACEMAAAADKLTGVSAPTHAVLRQAWADGGRMVRRALALHVVRDDCALDVGAIVRGAEGLHGVEAVAHATPTEARAELARSVHGEVVGVVPGGEARSGEAPAPRVAGGASEDAGVATPTRRDAEEARARREEPREMSENETVNEETGEVSPQPQPEAPPVVEVPQPSAQMAPRAEPDQEFTASPVEPSRALTLDPSDPRWALALQPASARDAFILAKVLHRSNMFPKFRTPDAIFAVLTMGRERGISALLSLQGMHVIDGKVELAADMIAALVLRSGKAKRFACVEATDERAVYEAQRQDDPAPIRVEFTKKHAQERGLWGKGNWGKMPDVMLAHRCCTKAARLKFPDVVMGLYGNGEIREARGEEVDEALATTPTKVRAA